MKVILDKIIFRGADPTGHGYYGAARGNRKHKGVDLVTSVGEPVFSPINGTISKLGYPYKGNLKFRYVEITNDKYRVRVMYCNPLTFHVGHRIFEGDKIGVAQNISEYWNPKMLNHIHIELYKNGLLTDPEPLLL